MSDMPQELLIELAGETDAQLSALALSFPYRKAQAEWPVEKVDELLSTIVPMVAMCRVLNQSWKFPNLDRLLGAICKLPPHQRCERAINDFKESSQLLNELTALLVQYDGGTAVN